MHAPIAICALVALLAPCAFAIPIDNGIVGDPEIFCGPTSIQVTFNTKNPFEGHVYVKNRFVEEGCRTDGDKSRSIGQIELDFSKCGVQRERSLNPKGVFVRSTIVITFHPRFITKIDRAFTFQCFYMEADKTVTTDLEVSEITTAFQTEVVPMPVCRYEILDSPSGSPVKFALIGMGVFHKWTCDTDTVNTFCMTVHSCTVDDGNGDNLQLINENGCALDRYLMNNIEYPTDLMGVKEVHVFKYADRPALFFNCQITILVKEPNGQCQRPTCAEPGGRGDGSGGAGGAASSSGTSSSSSSGTGTTKGSASIATTGAPAASPAPAPSSGNTTVLRFRRSASVAASENAAGTLDVFSPEIQMLDIEPDSDDLPASLSRLHNRHGAARVLSMAPSDGFCFSPATFYSTVVFIVILLVASIGAAIALMLRRK